MVKKWIHISMCTFLLCEVADRIGRLCVFAMSFAVARVPDLKFDQLSE